MIIKRYMKEYIKLRSEAVNMNNPVIRPCVRPCSILSSIKASLVEVKEFNEGKRKLSSLMDSKKQWDEWIREVESGK